MLEHEPCESRNVLKAEYLTLTPTAGDFGSYLQDGSQIEFTVTHCELFSLPATDDCQSSENVVISVSYSQRCR